MTYSEGDVIQPRTFVLPAVTTAEYARAAVSGTLFISGDNIVGYLGGAWVGVQLT